MAYNPLTGRYTPDKPLTPTVTIGGVQAGYKPAGAPNFITGAGIPEAAPAPKAVPYRGFRAAEDESNIGAPEYTPSNVTPTGEFIEEEVNKRNTEEATQRLLLERQIAAEEEADRRDRQSAYDILYGEFNKYGLGGLVEDIKGLIESNLSPSQFSIELQNRPAYQARFAANKERIAKGLRALSPAEYIGLEDQYQEIMRNYGLPASYYAKDDTGKQVGFEKFIAGDVSAVELEDRIATAQKRVINANPEVTTALKQFYPDITNGDILAYTLDPAQGLEGIKRKVTAAEIGGAALQSGLTTGMVRAEELQRYGVDKAAAEKGYSTIGAGLQRGSQLAAIYGENPYTQTTAEQEIFNVPGAEEARKARQKITGLEKAAFGGQTGITSGALARDRAGGY
jgi:hypothetical protein